jgi:hypothetical protein
MPSSTTVEDYRVDHIFESIGQRSMLINATTIHAEEEEEELILMAIAEKDV